MNARRAIAVVGAAFGDEGKGHMVDFLAHSLGHLGPVVNVRHNGGAQAGHTVVSDDGVAHVFSTFGSASLRREAQTYLGPEFVFDSAAFLREEAELSSKVDRMPPPVLCDQDTPISFPIDAALCRAAERARGSRRHGSCGYGIRETIVRNEAAPVPVWEIAHATRSKVREIVAAAQDGYMPRRALELGIDPNSVERFDLDKTAAVLQNGAQKLVTLNSNPPTNGLLLFEGAQGLLLDQNRKEFFPHLTPSSTGLTNVLPLCVRWNVQQLDVVYVMRSYMTRHGAGLFRSEDLAMRFEDTTNAPNEWQGKLRFGRLDTSLVKQAIYEDLQAAEVWSNGRRGPEIQRVGLAVTCLDQHGGWGNVARIERELRLPVAFASFGRKRNEIVAIDPEWMR